METDTLHEAVFSEVGPGNSQNTMVRAGEYKHWKWGGREPLFHLADDLYEQHNLVGRKDPKLQRVVREMRQRLVGLLPEKQRNVTRGYQPLFTRIRRGSNAAKTGRCLVVTADHFERGVTSPEASKRLFATRAVAPERDRVRHDQCGCCHPIDGAISRFSASHFGCRCARRSTTPTWETRLYAKPRTAMLPSSTAEPYNHPSGSQNSCRDTYLTAGKLM